MTHTFHANFDVIMWDAVFRAYSYYNDNFKHDNQAEIFEHRQKWLIDNYGIDHATDHITIVDQAKYMMLLLKFS